MATWPSGTKAGTTNLDAGTDSPRLARPDIKTNVDNVNAIIDMFNIDSPSANQILKYNSSNARFELAADATGTSSGITFSGDDSAGIAIADGGALYIQGGTNITTTTNSDGTLTINGPVTSSFITASSSDTLTNKSGAVSMFTNDAGYITNNGNGDITFVGSTITSPSNADITLDPAGTGVINNNATVRFNVGYQEDINA